MPTLPRVLLSPIAVAPQISEQKTSGTTSICIDEALTDDIENTVYQYILHKFHVRRGDMQHNTQNGAHNQRNKDLRCQTDFLFLFRSAHLCAPPFFVLK